MLRYVQSVMGHHMLEKAICIKILIIICFLLSFELSASTEKASPFEQIKNDLDLSETSIRSIQKEKIVVESLAKTLSKAEQSFHFKGAGLHPRSCKKGLRKLSLYQSYKDYLSFIKKSEYSDKTKNFYLVFDSPLLPFKMSLKFKIDRLKKPGHYNFTFDHGFFKGLLGTISIYDAGEKCLYAVRANWKGKHTKIPAKIIEFFTETLGASGIKALFRIANT